MSFCLLLVLLFPFFYRLLLFDQQDESLKRAREWKLQKLKQKLSQSWHVFVLMPLDVHVLMMIVSVLAEKCKIKYILIWMKIWASCCRWCRLPQRAISWESENQYGRKGRRMCISAKDYYCACKRLLLVELQEFNCIKKWKFGGAINILHLKCQWHERPRSFCALAFRTGFKDLQICNTIVCQRINSGLCPSWVPNPQRGPLERVGWQSNPRLSLSKSLFALEKEKRLRRQKTKKAISEKEFKSRKDFHSPLVANSAHLRRHHQGQLLLPPRVKCFPPCSFEISAAASLDIALQQQQKAASASFHPGVAHIIEGQRTMGEKWEDHSLFVGIFAKISEKKIEEWECMVFKGTALSPAITTYTSAAVRANLGFDCECSLKFPFLSFFPRCFFFVCIAFLFLLLFHSTQNVPNETCSNSSSSHPTCQTWFSLEIQIESS